MIRWSKPSNLICLDENEINTVTTQNTIKEWLNKLENILKYSCWERERKREREREREKGEREEREREREGG